MSFDETSADRNVEIWKIKKLIKSLEMARGLAIWWTAYELNLLISVICQNGAPWVAVSPGHVLAITKVWDKWKDTGNR